MVDIVLDIGLNIVVNIGLNTVVSIGLNTVVSIGLNTVVSIVVKWWGILGVIVRSILWLKLWWTLW